MTNKQPTMEELEDEIKSLMGKRNKAMAEINSSQKTIDELTEKYLSMNDNFVKIKCLTCNGVGYIQGDDGKKKVCNNPSLPSLSCRGKCYIWLEKYNEEIIKEE